MTHETDKALRERQKQDFAKYETRKAAQNAYDEAVLLLEETSRIVAFLNTKTNDIGSIPAGAAVAAVKDFLRAAENWTERQEKLLAANAAYAEYLPST